MTLSIRIGQLLVAMSVLACCEFAQALDRDTAIAQFHQTVWTAKDGTPSDTWAMAQTADGWMWFGAPSGLYRFDGVRFERVHRQHLPSDQSDAVSALYATPSGELLVGYLRGGVSVLKDGRFTHYREASVMGTAPVFALAGDGSGVLWASARDRLLRFDGERWQRIGQDWNYPEGFSYMLLIDRRGTLWASAKEHVWSLAKGSRRFEARLPITSPGEVIESPDGRVWFASPHDLRLMSDQKSLPDQTAGTANSRASFVSMFDRDGAFWVIADPGLARMSYPERAGNAHYAPPPSARIDAEAAAVAEEVLPGGAPKTLLEDRDGNIWAADNGTTVRRLRNVNVVRLIPTSGQEWPVSVSFSAVGGGPLLITARASQMGRYPGDGLWTFENGQLVRMHAEQLPVAQSAYRDSHGGLWVAGLDALWRESRGQLVKDHAFPLEWHPSPVAGLAPDFEGNPWVTVLSMGLFRRVAAGWERNGGIAALPQEAPVRIAAGADGRLWLGYGDGSVMTVDRGVAAVVASAGSAIGSVTAISARRTLLAGGERGLMLLREGKPLVLVPDEPSVFESVSGIIELDDGDVWLNTRAGAVRIRDDAMRAAIGRGDGRVQTEVFGSADGYPGEGGARSSTSPNTIAQSSDGLIWVSGSDGLAAIDPKRIRRNQVAPMPLVRALTTDSGRLEPAPLLSLAAGTRSIRIDYTGLSYSQPERQSFRYRLTDVQSNWVDAGARREAFYTNLGPGSYRFELLAANENGVWSETPASLSFEVAPTFVQTWPFRIACLLGALAMLGYIVHWRLRQVVARERMRHEDRLRERERIARELHDTLLQGTQGFVLKVQVAANLVARDNRARQMLDDALANADQVMTEGRDRIQHLRTLGVEACDLPEALERLGQALSQADGTRCTVTVEGRARAMNVQVADEAYQIAREAMTNACRHASARTVETRIIYADRVFRVQVRDDGQGFDSETNNGADDASHWGLTGMRERAEAIGAQLEIRTREGVGTEVELQLPARAAYLHDRKR